MAVPYAALEASNRLNSVLENTVHVEGASDQSEVNYSEYVISLYIRTIWTIEVQTRRPHIHTTTSAFSIVVGDDIALTACIGSFIRTHFDESLLVAHDICVVALRQTVDESAFWA